MARTLTFTNKPDELMLIGLALGESALETGTRKLAALERGDTDDVIQFLVRLLTMGDKSAIKHILLSMQEYNRDYVAQIRAEAKRRGIEPSEDSPEWNAG